MRILAINSGSSSLKFALYDVDSDEEQVLSGNLSGIGQPESRFRVRREDDRTLVDERIALPDPREAVAHVLGWLEDNGFGRTLEAVGHRIVHGGQQFVRPILVTAEVMENLAAVSSIDPEHMPRAIAVVRSAQRAFPHIPHVLCFDTAFHREMPAVARTIPVPRSLREEGLVRYGFHGLSYEYLVEKLGPDAQGRRIVIAHLGNGASMVAVRNGRSVETTMGFSPTGGLVMSTRSGDLDPSVVLYLLRQKRMNASEITALLNKQSGLLGVSGLSSDMQELLSKTDEDAHAALAVELFCYRTRQALGGLVVALGGLDLLIFTGGIGENAPTIRRCICDGLQFLGVGLDDKRNDSGATLISADNSPVEIRVLKTNEELMIARHTFRLIGRAD